MRPALTPEVCNFLDELLWESDYYVPKYPIPENIGQPKEPAILALVF